MEVLRHGRTYKTVECKDCGALLSYCENDIIKKPKYYEVFGGDWHSVHEEHITCPECNNKIILSLIIDGEETVK